MPVYAKGYRNFADYSALETVRWKNMSIKKIMTAAFSVAILSAACFAAGTSSQSSAASDNSSDKGSSAATAAQDTADNTSETTETTTEPTTVKKYTVTFLDFDGNPMGKLEVEEGMAIDYTLIDTSPLDKHLDVSTEQDFSSWDITPAVADKDYTIRALSRTAHIYLVKKPDKTRYFSTKGKVLLDGLQVYIDLSVQTPQKDKNGKYITEKSTIEVSSSCIARPATLSAAFGKSDNATITVYPIGDKKPICTFDIVCYRDLGDINLDGTIDSIDASIVLSIYANLAASKTYKPSDSTKKLSDVNMDGDIDAYDATYILKYYAAASTAKSFMDWDNIIDYDKILKNNK